MSQKQFMQELGKGFPAPVYLLHAHDAFLLKEAELMVSRSIPEEERSFSFMSYDAKSPSDMPGLDHIMDALNTIAFFGRRKVVAIENIQEFSRREIEKLGGYLGRLSHSSLLLLLCQGSPEKAFGSIMERLSAISLDIREQDLPSWLKEKARLKGFAVSDDAVEYLIGIIGPDAGLLSSEIEKLALIGKSHIEVHDIVGLVRGAGDYDAFDLVDALRGKDVGRVFSVAKALRDTQEPYGLLGAINWHYSRLAAKERHRRAYYDKVFAELNAADAGIKMSGGAFPIEYLLVRLLRL